MPRDAQNELLTAASEDASRAYNHAVEGYLSYRADTGQRVTAMLAADPGCGREHVLKGYLAMTLFDGTPLPCAEVDLPVALERRASDARAAQRVVHRDLNRRGAT